MMNKLEKFIKSTMNKLTLLSVVSAIIVVLGVVVLALFGYSTDTTNDDVKTLTVRVNTFAFDHNYEQIVDVCDDVFDEVDVDFEYVQKGEMSGDEKEIVYVFDKKTDLAKAKETLTNKFSELTKVDAESELAGASVRLTTHSERNPDKLPGYTLVRTIIAGAAFALLASAYVAIRHKLTSGATLFVTMGVGAALTCALILITRLPITGSLVYVLFFNLFFTAIATMFTLNKVRELQKSNEEMNAQELISEGLAIKPVLVFAVMVAVALVLVGVIATHAVRMFALISLIGLVAGVFSALFFAPAFYLPIKSSVDAKAAQRARYDYKKGSKKEN